MSKKRRVHLTHFGDYLRAIRILKDAGTQQQVADVVTKLCKQQKNRKEKVSQGLIAKYEKGNIGDPNQELLLILAKIYHVDYIEMVLQLVEEKYALGGKKWEALKRTLPRDQCTFCKLAQESLGKLTAIHKH